MGTLWTITDARGKEVILWNGGAPEQMLESLSTEERNLFSDMVWSDQFMLTRKVTRSAVLYMACVIGMSIVLALLFHVFKSPSWPNYMVSVVVAVPVTVISVLWFRFRIHTIAASPEYTRAMVELQRCPACLYKLKGPQVETDGCTVCPECGGAWRLPTERT